MRELSLHILDIAENSVKAGADLVEIGVAVSFEKNNLIITVKDDGCGMSREFVKRVTDPFTTTRKTRKVGMGIPLFKMAAETTGGSFQILSEEGKGTEVRAEFVLDSIDRAPLGDISETIITLLSGSTLNSGKKIDFVFSYKLDEKHFEFDTRDLRAELGEGIPLDEPDVLGFVRDLLKDNIEEINGGAII